jgi:hypothetical protein
MRKKGRRRGDLRVGFKMREIFMFEQGLVRITLGLAPL